MQKVQQIQYSGWKHTFQVDRRCKAVKGPEPDNVCGKCGFHVSYCTCGIYAKAKDLEQVNNLNPRAI